MDYGSIHEQFDYAITDFSQFDPGTPPTFNFSGHGLDREQALYVQDLMRLGRWTLSAGLRWDHYHLVVDRNALSPRLGIAWYWPRADLVLHASYDRVFPDTGGGKHFARQLDRGGRARSAGLAPSRGTLARKFLRGRIHQGLFGQAEARPELLRSQSLITTPMTMSCSIPE